MVGQGVDEVVIIVVEIKVDLPRTCGVNLKVLFIAVLLQVQL